MAASVQAVNGLEKITTELKRSECRVFFDAEDLEESTKFQRVYNSINTQQVDKQTLFNPEVISETISMLMYKGVITRDNSITLERFLQTFYIVNDADATNFGIDKMTLQKYFNSLSTCVFIKPTKYIELIAVIPAVNLNGFIDLYQYIHRKLFPNSGGKRRKSISRTRGPSKHKRRRSSAKRTSTKPRHTTRRRRTKHRRH